MYFSSKLNCLKYCAHVTCFGEREQSFQLVEGALALQGPLEGLSWPWLLQALTHLQEFSDRLGNFSKSGDELPIELCEPQETL